MIRFFIATLVGAAILFAWHTLSWTVLPIHFNTFKYTSHQDALLNHLDTTLKKKGAYMLLTADNRKGNYYSENYQKELTEVKQSYQNQPKALVYFSPAKERMRGTLGWGIAFYLISALIAVIFLTAAQGALNTFFQRWWFVMLLPVIICIMGPLADWNWLNYPWHYVKDVLLDQFVGWSLCALWLAYYVR